MREAVKQGLKISGAVLLIVVLVSLSAFIFYDWNQLRPYIAERSEDRLGRRVEIQGPLDVSLGLTPRIVAKNVRVANAPWGREPFMFEAEQAQVEVRLIPLIRGRVEIVDAVIVNASIALEQNQAGEYNWEFLLGSEPTPLPEQRFPHVERLDLRNIDLLYDDHTEEGRLTGRLERVRLDAEDEISPLTLTGGGNIEDLQFSVKGRLGSSRAMDQRGRVYPVEIAANLGEQEIRLSGHTGPRLAVAGSRVELSAKGQNLHSDLAGFGFGFGVLPAYQVSTATEANAQQINVEDLRATFGYSQLKGQASLQLEPLLLSADVRIPRLHLPDFDGIWTEPQVAILDAPLPLELLKTIDFAVDALIAQITDDGIDTITQLLDHAHVSAELMNGVLRISPLRAEFPFGRIETHGKLNSTKDMAHLDLEIELAKLQLRETFDAFYPATSRHGWLGGAIERAQQTAGTVRGDAHLRAEGRTPRQMLESLDGSFRVAAKNTEDVHVSAKGQFGPMSPERIYPLEMDLTLGHQHLRLTGRTGPKLALSGSRFQITAEGHSLHDDLRFYDIQVGLLPPYRLSTVVEPTAQRIHIPDLRATFGYTQVVGQALLELDPPVLRADIRMPRLHLADFTGLGADYHAASFGTHLPLEALRAVDWDIEASVTNVTSDTMIADLFRGAKMRSELTGGFLRIAPLTLAFPFGEIETHGTLDVRKDKGVFDLEVQIKEASVREVMDTVFSQNTSPWLATTAQLAEQVADAVAATVNLEGQGQTLREVIESLTGSFDLAAIRGDLDFSVHGDVGAMRPRKTRPLEVDVIIGHQQLRVSGHIASQLALAGSRLEVSARGRHLHRDLNSLGFKTGHLPGYALETIFEPERRRIEIKDLRIAFGYSQITGHAALELDQPRLTADLSIPRLHVEDFSGFGREDLTLLEARLPLEAMRTFDLAIDAVVTNLTTGTVIDDALSELKINSELANGVLRLTPLTVAFQFGRIEAYTTVDASQNIATVHIEMEMRDARLQEIIPELYPPEEAEGWFATEAARLAEETAGTIGGSAELHSYGRSPAEMIASLSGTFGVAMERGSTSYVIDRLIALDLAGLGRWLIGDRAIDIDCMISLFDIQDGVATPRVVLFASEDTNVWGEGEINLREGTIDMELEALPRAPGIGTLRSPILIEGDLTSPTIRPRLGPIALRGIAAAALGALAAPVAGLLGTITTGPGEEAVCSDYWSKIQEIMEGDVPAGNPSAEAKD